MDHLDSLRVFIAVADTGGFAKAARRLGLSAPAATRAIGALEQRLSARLLLRTTRSLRLTDAGERFLADCRRIVMDLEDAEAAAGGVHAQPRGTLAITAPSMFGRLHMAPLVLDFLAQHPQVGARTLFVDRLVHLLEEGIDVALRIARLPDSGLSAVPVGATRVMTVATPAYLAQHGTPLLPADLLQHQGIGFAQDGAQRPPWSFYPPGRKTAAARELATPPMRLVANTSELSIAAALRGQGFVRALAYQLAEPLQTGALRAVLTDWEPVPVPVHLVTLAGRHGPAKQRAFVDFAVERLRALPVLAGAAFLAA